MQKRNVKTRITTKIFLVLAFLCCLKSTSGAEMPRMSVSVKDIGTLFLQSQKDIEIEAAQLVLKKAGGRNIILETLDGLEPVKIFKANLDMDQNPEIVAVFKHPDGTEVIPIIYQTKDKLERIYPENIQDDNLLTCRDIFISHSLNGTVLCAKHLVNYHDYGPPNLFRIENYKISNKAIVKISTQYTESTHFNIYLNKGGLAFNTGKYLEALKHYQNAISSSTGYISEKAILESLFFQAEARKRTKDFEGALKLFQTIVINYPQNEKTDDSQNQIELISSNLAEKQTLSLFIDISNQAELGNWKTVLELINIAQTKNQDKKLWGRFLFLKAEALTALDRIEEAIKIYKKIKQEFPNSSIISRIDTNLQDLEEGPDEVNGL